MNKKFSFNSVWGVTRYIEQVTDKECDKYITCNECPFKSTNGSCAIVILEDLILKTEGIK